MSAQDTASVRKGAFEGPLLYLSPYSSSTVTGATTTLSGLARTAPGKLPLVVICRVARADIRWQSSQPNNR